MRPGLEVQLSASGYYHVITCQPILYQWMTLCPALEFGGKGETQRAGNHWGNETAGPTKEALHRLTIAPNGGDESHAA